MSAEFQNVPPTEQPIRVPCPPPAPRMPPKAYRSPPLTLSGISKPIPWPPFGARFPGDRIFWPPMQFPELSITHGVSVSELDHETDPVSEPVILAFDLVEDVSESVHEDKSIPDVIDGLTPANHPIGETAAAEADGRKSGFCSLTPKAAYYVNRTFRIKNGLHVHAGDWIRDSQLGLGRILKLNTDPDESDRHQIWFVGNTEEGTVVERHALYSTTLGIIDQSMVPEDIRLAAPGIEPLSPGE